LRRLRDLDFLLEGERDDLRRERERDLDFFLGGGDFDFRREVDGDLDAAFFLGGGEGGVFALVVSTSSATSAISSAELFVGNVSSLVDGFSSGSTLMLTGSSFFIFSSTLSFSFFSLSLPDEDFDDDDFNLLETLGDLDLERLLRLLRLERSRDLDLLLLECDLRRGERVRERLTDLERCDRERERRLRRLDERDLERFRDRDLDRLRE